MSDDEQHPPHTATGRRLYRLLPAIYQIRDVEQGYPLATLVDAIASGVDQLRGEIGQLYDSWFIETCPDWVVPYLADLVGFKRISAEGDSLNLSTEEGRGLTGLLYPRAEVANTIAHRRRKGTLAVLELLARDVAGWPARAVECYDLVALLGSPERDGEGRAGGVQLSDAGGLGRLGGPFDSAAHTLDVRAITDPGRPGRYNLPGVGLYVWRLRAYSATYAPARRDARRAGGYRFSPRGRDLPLFISPTPEGDPTGIADEVNVPAPLRRQALRDLKAQLYGPGRSLCIFRKKGNGQVKPVPAHQVEVADLSGWESLSRQGLGDVVLVDPELGRLVVGAGSGDVHVSYHYGFSADIGGGEYPREVAAQRAIRVSERQAARASRSIEQTIDAALKQWKLERAGDAVDFLDSGDYRWPLPFSVTRGRRLQLRAVRSLARRRRLARKTFFAVWRGRTLHLRAVRGVRPTLRLEGDAAITLRAGCSLALEGLLLTGAPLRIAAEAGCHISVSHCTLAPARQGAAALTIAARGDGVTVEVDSSIVVGPLAIETPGAREKGREVALHIAGSIVDAAGATGAQAIGPGGAPTVQPIRLFAQRSTILGDVAVRGVDGLNTIFDGRVAVTAPDRKPADPTPPPDSLRHCYVRETDLAQAARQYCVTPDTHPGVRPYYASRRYGDPRYCRLSERCPEEIARGAGDGGELGVYHDLHLRLRADILGARLDEFSAAAMRAAILFAD